MPTYEYVCTACSHAWDELQKITEPAVEICPKCSEKTARRQISGGNFILKGGGWYADLYSSSKPSAGGESKSGETKSAEAKPAEAKPAEAKPAEKKSQAPAAGSGGGSSSSS